MTPIKLMSKNSVVLGLTAVSTALAQQPNDTPICDYYTDGL